MKKPRLIYIISSILFCSLGSSINKCYAQEEKKELSPENPIEERVLEPLEGKEENTEDKIKSPSNNLELKAIEALGIGTSEKSKKDSVELIVPEKNSFLKAIEISIDYLKLVSTLIPSENKAEGAMGLLFRKNIMLMLEGGYGDLQPRKAYKNSNYRSTGIYGRLGLDYVMPFDAKNNMILGARYGQSHFEDQAEWKITNDLWGIKEESFHRRDLIAHWAELIFATEANFKNNFYYGMIFRFRVLIKYAKFENEHIPIFSIPGYGRTMDRTIPALNLFIKYKIPL